MNQKSHTRIPKKRAISQLIGKKNFDLKVPNTFFYQVLPEKGPLSSEDTIPQNTACGLPFQNECSEIKLDRETETSYLAPTLSAKAQVRTLKQAYSLPQIKKKGMQKDSRKQVTQNQILKSQLGCFSYFQILQRREQAQAKKRDFLTRNSSFVSEEDVSNYLISTSKEEVSYEEYDNRLMEIKYNLERVKKVRFRHKVEWSIAQ